MRIERVSFLESLDECISLVQEHRDELATYKAVMELNPDREHYKELEDEGRLLTLVLKDDDDKIVGYSVLVFSRSLHYKDLGIAANDVIYVRKDLRNTGCGLKLLGETEIAARDFFAGQPFMMMFHAKEDTALVDLMPKLGYKVQDIIFSKVF